MKTSEKSIIWGNSLETRVSRALCRDKVALYRDRNTLDRNTSWPGDLDLPPQPCFTARKSQPTNLSTQPRLLGL